MSEVSRHFMCIVWSGLQHKCDGWLTVTSPRRRNISPANMEEFQKPFHIILNLALSGQFTGGAIPIQSEFPLYLYVDYVRVYQAGTSPTPVPTTAPTFQPPTTVPTAGPTPIPGSTTTLYVRSGGALQQSAGSERINCYYCRCQGESIMMVLLPTHRPLRFLV